MVEQECPLCRQSSYAPVSEIRDVTYDIPGLFRVVKCRGCGHLFLNPRPADESLMACYPADYGPHVDSLTKSKADGSDGPARQTDAPAPPTAQRGSILRQAAGRIPGLKRTLRWLGNEQSTVLPHPPHPDQSRLLEIGCAHGGFLERARQEGWIVDGVEPSLEAAKMARSRGIQVHCGLLRDAGIPACSREMVALWMVLEHVPAPRELLKQAHDILSPGGTIAFSVPNAATWERWLWGKHWLGYDAPRHLQMFTERRLAQLLGEIGYAQVRVVHQSNTRYWWGSVAAWGRSRFPNAQWPQRWMKYFIHEPPQWWNYALMIPGKINAVLRMSGRITVVAQKPTSL